MRTTWILKAESGALNMKIYHRADTIKWKKKIHLPKFNSNIRSILCLINFQKKFLFQDISQANLEIFQINKDQIKFNKEKVKHNKKGLFIQYWDPSFKYVYYIYIKLIQTGMSSASRLVTVGKIKLDIIASPCWIKLYRQEWSLPEGFVQCAKEN